MRALVMVAALATAMASGAVAQPVGEIVDPVWRAQPTPQQSSQTYPMRAMRAQKIGVAVVRCTAEADGALGGCELVCETPAKWGFGEAALGQTRYFRLEPTLADGRSVAGGTVTMPFKFNPPFLAPLPRCDGK